MVQAPRTQAIADKDREPGRNRMLSTNRAAVSMTTVESFLSVRLPSGSLRRVKPEQHRVATSAQAINTSKRKKKKKKKSIKTDRFALQDLLFHRLQADLLQHKKRKSHDTFSLSTSEFSACSVGQNLHFFVKLRSLRLASKSR